MNECDEVLEAAFLGQPLDAGRASHVSGCPRCRHALPAIERVSRLLAADSVPAPPPVLGHAVLAAAEPILAARRNAATPGYRRGLAYAIAAALLPLPLVLVLDAYVVQVVHAVLSALLPGALSAYLVFNFAALMLLGLALAYGAVPFLVDRQLRPARPAGYA